MNTKTIIILANSRKNSGGCIVGKEIKSKKWIRPVSARKTEEISEEEMSYKNGDMPKPLDIIKIPIKKHKPSPNQQENHLIEDGYYWEKIGEYSKNLETLSDTPKNLWGVGNSSKYGKNDRIPKKESADYSKSAYLIKPDSLKIQVAFETAEFFNPKPKARAQFTYNNKEYILSVTDPLLEKKYLPKYNLRINIYLPVKNIYLCVSIGKPYKGYCYKFLASLIEDHNE